MKKLAFLIALIAGVAISAPARSEERAPRVAIVSTVMVNVDDALAVKVATELGATLSKKLVVDAIAGEEANRRLPDGKVPQGCVAEKECILEIVERLDADQVLFLAVIRLNDRLQIDPTWSDATGTRVISRSALVVGIDDSWANTFEAAATSLLPDAAERLESKTEIRFVEAPGKPTRKITTGVWVAGSVSAAALVGAVSFSIAAKKADNRLQDNQCDLRPCNDSLIDSLDRRALAADLLYGAFLAAGVTAGVLYYVSDRTSDDGLDVQASVLPSGGAVFVKGAF